MSIQESKYTSKKTGKTTVKYYAAVWDPENQRLIPGQKRQKRSDAEKDEIKLKASILNGEPPEPKRPGTKFDKIALLWLEASEPPVYSVNTYQTYKYCYGYYIKDLFGDRPINKITPIHIQKYVNLCKKKYAPETTNKLINILSNIFNFAITLKEISKNPVSGIKRIKVPRHTHETWNDDTIQYFLNLKQVQNSNYYEMLCVSLLIGPRPSEVCGLRETALLNDPPALDFSYGYDRYGTDTDMKTWDSHRIVYIPDALYRILHKKLIWKKQKRLANNTFGNNDYLFVSINGNPIKPTQYSRAFKRLIAAHNAALDLVKSENGELDPTDRYLSPIPLYNCRHSFATNSMKTHYDPALIASIMGNSPQTLMKYYVQVSADRQLDLINKKTEKIFSKAT